MNRQTGLTRQHSSRPTDARTIPQIEAERPWATARYLRRLIFEKRLPYYKVGRRVLVSLAELDELVANGRIEARR
jgi:excisionase family DNA binding protein